jgi:hypothetical protein
MATAAVINGAINGFNSRESNLSSVAVESVPAEKSPPITQTKDGASTAVRDGPDVDETSPYYNPRLKLVDRFVDEPRPLRVGVIGAGLAGISAGILLPAKVPGIKLTIYEKNADVVRQIIGLLECWYN